MRISKKLREEAAQLCQVVASNSLLYFEAENAVGMTFNDAAGELARDAHYAAMVHVDDRNEAAAEAEAMLRTGWSP